MLPGDRNARELDACKSPCQNDARARPRMLQARGWCCLARHISRTPRELAALEAFIAPVGHFIANSAFKSHADEGQDRDRRGLCRIKRLHVLLLRHRCRA
jgi:hypothetical protein